MGFMDCCRRPRSFSQILLILLGLSSFFLLDSGCSRNRTPEERLAFMKDGESYLAKRDYARALIQFRNAGKIKASSEAYYQAALAFIGQGDMNSAARQLIAATKLDPNNHKAQIKLAELMISTPDKELYEPARKLLGKHWPATPATPKHFPPWEPRNCSWARPTTRWLTSSRPL